MAAEAPRQTATLGRKRCDGGGKAAVPERTKERRGERIAAGARQQGGSGTAECLDAAQHRRFDPTSFDMPDSLSNLRHFWMIS